MAGVIYSYPFVLDRLSELTEYKGMEEIIPCTMNFNQDMTGRT